MNATTLGAQATARPWRRSGPGPYPDGDALWIVGKRDFFVGFKEEGADEVLTVDASVKSIADLDFIVYAVNHIEAVEARLAEVTKALADLVAQMDHSRMAGEEEK